MAIVNKKADDYFSKLNSIASKIFVDINETVSSYEHIWNELKLNEQIDLINQTIIKPEIMFHYFQLSSSNMKNGDIDNDNVDETYMFNGKNLSTYCKMRTGLKKLQDDTIGIIVDEHSTPFNVKTKSQLDLALFQRGEDNYELTTENNSRNIRTNQFTSPCKSNGSQINLCGNINLQNCYNLSKNDYIKNDKLLSYNDEKDYSQTLATNGRNFFQKLINKTNLMLSTSLSSSSATAIIAQNVKNDTQYKKNVNNISQGMNSSSQSSEEDGDDEVEKESDKTCNELNALFQATNLGTDYDFLNNW